MYFAVLIPLTLFVFFYYKIVQRFTYWKRHGVPQLECFTIIKDTLTSLIKQQGFARVFENLCKSFSNNRYFGIYQLFGRALVIKDADLIKKITVKDFEHFVDHVQFSPGNEPIWERNLISLKGDQWKSMRSILSPSFTSSKMKMMFNLMMKTTNNFVSFFEEEFKGKRCVEMEWKDVFMRFANDVIASIAFGYSCDSLRDRENQFYVTAKKFVPDESLLQNLKTFMTFKFPYVAKLLGFTFLDKTVTEFFWNIIRQNVKEREQKGIVRYDMIHLLMEERRNRDENGLKEAITDIDIAAQALLFFFAGFESVSALMSFTAYELAVNVDIQKRLQTEVDETLAACNGTITYEALVKMPYLDMVISESLRKWPGGITTERVCTKPYEIKPENSEKVSVFLQKGDIVWIPIFGIHRDPNLFLNPERYDPERFSEKNKLNMNSYGFIPFGSGPRSCIGNRFVLMEAKLLFCQFLSKFKFVVVEKTDVPIELAEASFKLTAKEGFWLGAELLVLTFFYYVAVKPLTYWKKRGVPQFGVLSLLKGLGTNLVKQQGLAQAFQQLYNAFPNSRYFGIYQYGKRALVVKDVDLIKKITVKDFEHFINHVEFTSGNDELWERNLSALKGERWKNMRSALSPSFTGSKMKMMFNLMLETTNSFVSFFEEDVKKEECVVVEMKDVFTRFANDVIASMAFGYSCDSLREKENRFYASAKKIVPDKSFVENMKQLVMYAFPKVAKFFGFTFWSKKTIDFFCGIIKQNIKEREEKGIVRYDMVHLMMEEKKSRERSGVKETITDIDIAAQAMLFFFAGFETVSTLMSFTAYELAVNEDVQHRLQAEIDDALRECNGTITYETLVKMQYLDMVISESLRKWPGAIITDRVCTKPYEIQPENPEEIPVHLQKNDILFIPIFGIHRDSNFFPNPERFDPDRFSEENKSNLNSYAFIPFGSGPRACIANRFALMETKLLFFQILSKFKIVVVEKTDVPIQLAEVPITLTAKNGFWLGLKMPLLTLIYYNIVQRLTYWKKRGVPQLDVFTILKDIATGLIKQQGLAQVFQYFYNSFPNSRYFGIYKYTGRALVVKDADLIKKITVKDFEHFVDHIEFTSGNDPLWERNIFALQGERWKSMRSTLSPSFTSSKMKMMFNLMMETVDKFVSFFEEEIKRKGCLTLEMKNVFTRFATDVIASMAFGYSCDSLREENNKFYVSAKKIIPDENLIQNIKQLLMLALPKAAKLFGLTFWPKSTTNFFYGIIKRNVKEREEKGIVRYDMVHLMMEEKKSREQSNAKEAITDVDITAQAMLFFLAGFETVSTLMCFTAYELAVNKDVQKRLQAEVDDTLKLCNGTITYEALAKMTYLDMVISESLRKWPAAIVTDRVCTKPYDIQSEKPEEVSLHLKKGDIVWIPIFGIHRDPAFFPNPDQFDPERFSEENKSTINSYGFIPFGSGPRSCIANRFALMETKLLFFQIMSKFEIVVVEKTEVPVQLAEVSLQLTAKNGFWLGLKLRNLE
ncbi:hypothetical protein FQR65_LT01473 [Abscondita terminalis]|nr:hypothetical protein FQR65_LT01473 [Abscondita terminalis]